MKFSNKIFITVIAQAICASGIFAQSKIITIKGRVTDQSHSPVQYAAVENANSGEGITTNEKGAYTLKATLPLLLEATALGYKTWQSTISDTTKDTIYLNITLTTDSFQLRTVNIVNQYQPTLIDEAENLTDFDFKDGKLWMLYKMGKHSRLYVVDSADTKQAHVDLSFNPDSLARTVHGLLYTRHNDSVCFYYRDSEKIKQEKTTLAYLNFQTYHLIEYNFPYYYKYFESADNASVTYWYFDKMNGDSTVLYAYKSKEISQYDSIIYSEILYIIGTALGVKASPYSVNYKELVASRLRYSDGVRLTPDQSNQIFIYKFLLRNLLTIPHFVNDSMYIFNFDNDSVYVFDNKNKFHRQMPLIFDVHGTGYKSKDIIVDEEKKHCYFKYRLYGVDYLQEIDLTGKQRLGIQSVKYAYVRKIRISHGIAYFAHYTNSSYESGVYGHLSVYKQKLKAL